MATQYNAGTSAGQVLTAATMNSIGAAWETWTPALTATTTNPTLGTGGSTTGRWGRVQKIVVGHAQITFGTAGTAAGSGLYYVSTPTTAQNAGNMPVGVWTTYDGTATWQTGILQLDTSNRFRLMYGGTFVSNTTPWAWGTNDQIWLSFTYEAA
jgi:hypothetical protein